MARSIWKGSISFGLVNIPVTLYPAETRRDISLHLLDRRNNARVRYDRVNDATGEKVEWGDIVKAYELDDGGHVVLDDDDFLRAKPEATQTVEIEDFVARDAVPDIYFDKPYYLVPGKRGEKGYVLLRETLRRTGKAGIAKVVIRTRQYLAALIPVGHGLVLDLLRFQHELRDMAELDLPGEDLAEYGVSDRELQMAVRLVGSMTSDWAPGKYRDDYHEALLRWIEEKARRGGVAPPAAAGAGEAAVGAGAEVIDMMELLKQSVQQTRAGGRPEAGRAPARRPQARAGKTGQRGRTLQGSRRKKGRGGR